MIKKISVNVYTDGSWTPQPDKNGNKPGGWGAIVLGRNYTKQYQGGELHTTISRMELIGLINGLKQGILSAVNEVEEYFAKTEFKNAPAVNVHLYSDSNYCVKPFTHGWLYMWYKNNWRNVNHQKVKNIDLWKEVIELIKWVKVINKHYNCTLNFEIHKIKSHSGDTFNDVADALAVSAKKSVYAEYENKESESNEQF